MTGINIQINGRPIVAEEGSTILENALANGFHIPTLCYDSRLVPFGGCRMCLVEVEGFPGPLTACTTPVQEGMKITTESEELYELRRNTLKIILANHPNDCMVCQKSGECELQELAYRFDLGDVAWETSKFRKYPISDDNPFIQWDRNKCIMCGRCVRACAELVCDFAIGFDDRGFQCTVNTPFREPLQQGLCEFCGTCVSVCPTGALLEKESIGKGRVWEYEKTLSTCNYCGTGCQMYYHKSPRTGRIARVTGAATGPVNHGLLCVKGKFGFEYIHHPDRLTRPLIKKNGVHVEASWEEAVALVAKRLSEIKDKYGPDSIGFLSSSRCTNEENYLMQKIARAAVGTNNVDNCARICHSPSVAGLSAAFGSGAATNSFEQIYDADVLFVIGSNTTEAHPILGMKVKQAVARGAKLIVGDPRRIELVKFGFADIWLNLLPGSNVALLSAMMNVIIGEGLEDRDFIKKRTEGFEEFKKGVMKYTPESVAKVTGVAPHLIREAARTYAGAERAMLIYSLGMTEHTQGSENVMYMGNLALLTGNVGRPGTGINPLRGQNNVQGACDMCALPNAFVGYQKVTDPKARAKFEKAYGRKMSPNVGFTSTEMFQFKIPEGKIKAMLILGEDPAQTEPNILHIRKSLEQLEFLVVIEIFPSETTPYADVILPGASAVEKCGTFTNGERRVQLVQKSIEPLAGQADWETLCRISTTMGYPMDYSHPSEIWDEVAKLADHMFGGMNYKRMKYSGLQWPCPTPDHPGTETMYIRKFNTPSGKGVFNFREHKGPDELPDRQYPLFLTTGRRRQHYNNGSMSRRNASILEMWPEETIEINPADASALGIVDGDMVKVSSRRGSVEVKTHVTDRSQKGITYMSFHYDDCLTNILTNDALCPIAKTPEYKVCAIRVEKLGGKPKRRTKAKKKAARKRKRA